MIPIGWSVGDLIIAIQVLTHVVKAFDQAKGAKKQYAMSCGFLRQLIPVLERIRLQLEDEDAESLHDKLIESASAIHAAYEEFEHHLEKKFEGLSSRDPSRISRIVATFRWSLDELNDKVQKLRTRVLDAMGPYKVLMLQEILSKVTGLGVQYNRAAQSEAQSEERLKEVREMFDQIHEQNDALHKAVVDYRTGLDEQQQDQQSAETAAIRCDIAEIDAAQCCLLESQKELLAIVKQQRAQAQDNDEAARWEEFQKEEEEEARQIREDHQIVEGNIDKTRDALEGIRKAAKHPVVDDIVDRLGGVFEIFKAIIAMRPSRADTASSDPQNGSPVTGGKPSWWKKCKPAAQACTSAPIPSALCAPQGSSLDSPPPTVVDPAQAAWQAPTTTTTDRHATGRNTSNSIDSIRSKDGRAPPLEPPRTCHCGSHSNDAAPTRPPSPPPLPFRAPKLDPPPVPSASRPSMPAMSQRIHTCSLPPFNCCASNSNERGRTETQTTLASDFTPPSYAVADQHQCKLVTADAGIK